MRQKELIKKARRHRADKALGELIPQTPFSWEEKGVRRKTFQFQMLPLFLREGDRG
jgi:hypothetical protein